MKIIVNPHKIEIEKSPVNEREIDITKCEFEFAEEITNDYVKEAYFTYGDNSYKEIIFNNQCSIPNEVLQEKGQIEIGVVAYLVENEEEIKRYNPSPAYFNTWQGSLKDAENSEPITPSEMEQFEQALQDGLNELGEAVEQAENLNITSERVADGVEITTTDKYGEPTTTKVNDGAKGDKGDKGKTATIQIGTVTTLEAGSEATVENVGTINDGIFNFGIPQGIQGEQGEQGDDYVITQQDYNDIATVVKTDLQPTITEIQTTANNANTNANTAKSIAEGANQALSYNNYSAMVTAFNVLDDDKYKIGQNIYIVTRDVPDLWVSSIESTSSTYTYTTDAAFISDLTTNGYVQVGYYKLSALETQKVDLTGYVQKTTTIAGVDLQDNILDSELRTAINVENGAQANVIESIVTPTDTLTVTNKSASLPYATQTRAGVIRVVAGNGITIYNGGLATYKASTSEIAGKSNDYKVIVPSNLDYAIEKGLGNNSLTWTTTEKTNARNTIGAFAAENMVTLTQEEYDALVTKDSNTYYFIEEE